MRKVIGVFCAGLLFALPGAAQTAPEKQPPAQQQQENKTKVSTAGSANAGASAQAGENSASLESGTTFEAELSKSVGAKKNKPGDRVEAKATKDVKSNGQVVVPKNSKLIGRVTEAKARGEGQSESSLGILFEKAVTKDGREIPLNVAIQAVAMSRSALAAQSQQPDMMGSTRTAGSAAGTARGGAQGGGGLVGGATGAVGSTVGATTGAVGAVGQTAGGALSTTTQTAASATGAIGGVGGLDAAGNLTSTSSGVLGLQGMALQSEAASSAQGSVITSTTRNVQLESGTRLLLRAAGQASAASGQQ